MWFSFSFLSVMGMAWYVLVGKRLPLVFWLISALLEALAFVLVKNLRKSVPSDEGLMEAGEGWARTTSQLMIRGVWGGGGMRVHTA